MTNFMLNKKSSTPVHTLIVGAVIMVALGLVLGYSLYPIQHYDDHRSGMHHDMEMEFMEKEMDGQRAEFISHKESIINTMMAQGDYACCLETPCTYCIEKSPGHGEGAVCSCLADIVNGVHPCGECIGEILEGHGNRFLAPYFAKAISEKVGMEHIATIQEIIFEKYGLPASEQL